MTFDPQGNLSPYELIAVDWETVENFFVHQFPDSLTRISILTALRTYLDELRLALNIPFDIWIDGSFVTTKPNPNDVDFVIFVDAVVASQMPLVIQQFRDRRYQRVNLTDGYFLEIYPESHPNYRLSLIDKEDWLRIFGYDSDSNPKGIIQLTID